MCDHNVVMYAVCNSYHIFSFECNEMLLICCDNLCCSATKIVGNAASNEKKTVQQDTSLQNISADAGFAIDRKRDEYNLIYESLYRKDITRCVLCVV